MATPTVMVCEDEYFIRLDVSDHLREVGYRVLEAKDADCAQALFLSGEHVDLLSTDVMMPGQIDGLGLAAWVRETYPSCRIVVMTGYAKHRSAGQKYDGFFDKPCAVSDLVSRIKTLVPVVR